MGVKQGRDQPFYMLGELQVWSSLKNIAPALSLKNLTLSTAENAVCQVVTCLNASKPEDQQAVWLWVPMV